MNVTYNTHDLTPRLWAWRIGRPRLNVFADGILTRKILFGKRPRHDRDLIRFPLIALVERPTLQQRNLHRFEVVFRCTHDVCDWAVRLRDVLAFDIEADARMVVAHRQLRYTGNIEHSRLSSKVTQQVAHKAVR